MSLPATIARERAGPGPWTGEQLACVHTAFGSVVALRQSWSESIDIVGVPAYHWLQLSLLPRTRTERACFPEHWNPTHFESVGDVFLLPAGEPVHAKSECRMQRLIACVFNPEAIDLWLEENLEWTGRRLKSSLDLSNPAIRNLLFRLGEEICHPGFASDAMAELMAGQIAIELGRHFRAIKEIHACGGLAPWRLRLIDERLAEACESPSLAELAQLVGLSVRQLSRGFRASRGCSIGQHIAASRIEQAKRLLASSPSVKSVAYMLGFRSPANFTQAFRRVTGESPRAFQQKRARRLI